MVETEKEWGATGRDRPPCGAEREVSVAGDALVFGLHTRSEQYADRAEATRAGPVATRGAPPEIGGYV